MQVLSAAAAKMDSGPDDERTVRALPIPLTRPPTLRLALLLGAVVSLGTACGDDPLAQRLSDDLATPGDVIAEPAGCVADPGAAAVRYRVRRGDTLSDLALRVYGDAALWPEIAQANADKVGAEGELRAGDELVIPFAGR